MRETLLQLIDSAFPAQRLSPGAPVTAYVDEDTERQFGGTEWREHDPASIASMTHSLNFFSPPALVHFLPAYLRAALLLPDSGVADALVARLRPPKGDAARPSFLRWWALLDDSQREVICRFITLLAAPDDHDARALVTATRRTDAPR